MHRLWWCSGLERVRRIRVQDPNCRHPLRRRKLNCFALMQRRSFHRRRTSPWNPTEIRPYPPKILSARIPSDHAGRRRAPPAFTHLVQPFPLFPFFKLGLPARPCPASCDFFLRRLLPVPPISVQVWVNSGRFGQNGRLQVAALPLPQRRIGSSRVDRLAQ